MKGAKAQFKIKLHEIKTRIFTGIKRRFSKKAGKFDSLDKLKEDITKYLEESASSENERRKGRSYIQQGL